MATSSSPLTDLIAYAVPGFFLVVMGYVILSEMLIEPYGWSVSGAQVDNGSRVITMLVPTLLALALKMMGVIGVLFLAAMFFTKNGMKALQKMVGSNGKRLD